MEVWKQEISALCCVFPIFCATQAAGRGEAPELFFVLFSGGGKAAESRVWDAGQELGLCQGMGSQREPPWGTGQDNGAALTQHPGLIRG